MQRDDTVIAVFDRLRKQGKPATLLKTKDEKQGKSGQRDFIYAGDIAKAIMLAVKNKHVGKGEIFNICTGKLNTIEEIVTLMKMKIEWLPTRPYDVDRHLGDNKKARLILGWQPETEVLRWLANYIKL
jgi:nucleoside-diphosphate-sugar epimerase